MVKSIAGIVLIGGSPLTLASFPDSEEVGRGILGPLLTMVRGRVGGNQ